MCSTNNIEFAISLGSNDVVNYTKSKIFTDNHKYDLIFDTVAKLSFRKVKKYLTKNGRYITTLPAIDVILNPLLGLFSSKTAKTIWVKSIPEDLQFISKLIIDNKLRPHIDKMYDLKDVAKAHRYSETGRVVGKLAIKI